MTLEQVNSKRILRGLRPLVRYEYEDELAKRRELHADYSMDTFGDEMVSLFATEVICDVISSGLDDAADAGIDAGGGDFGGGGADGSF